MHPAITIAQDLIRFKSITPIDDGAIDYLASLLKNNGFKVEILEFGDDDMKVKNLYARFGSATPNFCFAGHTDVVPVGDHDAWSVDPFAGTIKNGKIIGRGTVDMKGAVAAFVNAGIEFTKSQKFTGSISFLITGDEEGASINGTKKVLEVLANRGEKIDSCIVGEPTNPEIFGEMLKNGRRGSITFKLEVLGKQGHVAYPHNAINPITILLSALQDIKSYNLDTGNEHFAPSNLEIVNIEVNNCANNVIPAKARATFNIRYNDLHTSGSLIKLINNLIQKHTDSFSLSADASGDAFITMPGLLTDIVSTTITEVLNIKPILSTSGGTSDARFIKDFAEVIEFGLINKTAHMVDEYSEIEDIAKLSKIYYYILEKYFQIQVVSHDITNSSSL